MQFVSAFIIAVFFLAAPSCARAEELDNSKFQLNWQVTNVTQRHPSFHSPYAGANSLKPDEGAEETTDATLYLGWRIRPRTEVWVNLEVDQGFGLSDTLGVAGFPSGEAYKVGSNRPYLRMHRAFVRHTVPLGGEPQEGERGPNRFKLASTADNLVFTLGRLSVVDLFDDNRYAHDPRADFLNWSLIDTGTFDYAADPWGYTWGAAVEWTHAAWTTRGGIFQMSPVPNDKIIKPGLREFEAVVEVEHRHSLAGREGTVRLLAFSNRARMGAYLDAVAAAGAATPSLAPVRRQASRAGVALNVEQEFAAGLGGFLRIGTNDGREEAYEFTEINRTVALGASASGAAWHRGDDRLGFAAVFNHLSSQAQAYFKAGGLGILIGDGALNYGSERIAELYYAARIAPWFTLSLDVQRIVNPAYNRDRGPVSVFGVRLHFSG